MKNKIIGVMFCVILISVLVIPIDIVGVKLGCNDFDISEKRVTCTTEKIHGCANIKHDKRFYHTNTDNEIIFTAPFEYVDNGTSWNVYSSEKHKWNNISYADDTGLCMLNVSAVNVSKWGKAEAHAVIGGITTASDTYEKPKAEFYFSGNFKMFDDIFLASKTQISLLYFYIEDGEVLDAGVLEEWQQETGTNEYTIDYTENPLSVELDAHRFGKNYTILLYLEAYIEATGGSGTCYIDASNASLERSIQIEKIRLYDACEWGSDLEVVEYLLTWKEVVPGSVRTGYIELHNVGTLCSKLDWKIFGWPDWGTWTFNPKDGENLTPEEGTIVVNVTITAPNEEQITKEGEVKIVNKQDPTNDFVILKVTLSTPKTKLSLNFIHTFLEGLIEHSLLLVRLLQLSLFKQSLLL